MESDDSGKNVIDLSAKVKEKRRIRAIDISEEDLLDGIDESLFTDHSKLKELNKEIAFIRDFNGKCAIMRSFPNPLTNKKKIVFHATESVLKDYANVAIPMGRSIIKLGHAWLSWSERRQYETVFFDPSLPEESMNCLNLWQGMDIQPKKGSWKRMRKHMWEIISNKDKAKFKYFVKWLAWCVQNPGERAEVAIALKGKEGSGKGVVFRQFVTIFGPHGRHISDMEHLTGRFNEHLWKTVFLFVDEAYMPDKDMGEFKRLVTEPTLSVEAKFQSMNEVKNCLHVVLSTNEDLVAFTKEDSRRVYINEVDNKYAESIDHGKNLKRRAYFDKIYKEMENGGRAAMLHDLLKLKLHNWQPRQNVPKTDETRYQMEKSDMISDKMMTELLDEGVFPGFIKDGLYRIRLSELREHLLNSVPKAKTVSDKTLAASAKLFGGKKLRLADGVYWLFPELNIVRQAYCERRGFDLNTRFTAPHEWIVPKQSF